MKKTKKNGEQFLLLPVLPLRGLILYPGVVSPVLLGRKSSLAALAIAQKIAVSGDTQIFAIAQRNSEIEEPTVQQLYDVGVIARIISVSMLPGGMAKVMLEGVVAAHVEEWIAPQGPKEEHLMARVEPLGLLRTADFSDEMRSRLLKLFKEYAEMRNDIPVEAIQAIDSYPTEMFLYSMAPFIIASEEMRQKLLECVDALRFATIIRKLIHEAIAVRQLDRRVEQEVQQEISRHQREYLIQEHIRRLGEELEDPTKSLSPEVAAIRQKIDQTPLTEEARASAIEEATRLGSIQPGSPEHSVIRNWLDTLLALPWGKLSKEKLNLRAISKALDTGHYGLAKPKERILEYVAVLSRAPEENAPILCLSGPPGVGKTSLARSMADALGRPYVRISLGGIRDEAEIRGHRRTYIGAMAGRIVTALRQAGEMNPLILLDEIDKMGKEYRGDPAGALMEVLDPEQNKEFRDHFLEVGLDLSKVLFVCTANIPSDIHPVLRDRMEVIRLPGYTSHEKVEIAKRHLVQRVRKQNGLSEEEFAIEEEALERIVRDWTKGGGVRGLERLLDKLARQRVLELASRKKRAPLVTVDVLEKRLGPPTYFRHRLKPDLAPGLINGLAWTSVGGEILRIECLAFPGKGAVKQTGMLGEVMRESVQIARSLLRKKAKSLKIPPEAFTKTDLHIHLPEGAIPKDGPSAGVALFLVMASVLTKRPIPGLHTFTGEISLTGEVHMIGGLVEKSLAALETGATDLWIPADNKNDIPELPIQVRKGLKIHLVSRIDQVLKVLLPTVSSGQSPKPKARAAASPK